MTDLTRIARDGFNFGLKNSTEVKTNEKKTEQQLSQNLFSAPN
jgi:hypothetical protein